MTSIIIRAGWQIQQIGQITPKEIKKKKMGWLAQVFKTSFFRILKEISEEIAYLKWQQVIKLEKLYIKMNQKLLKI